MLEAGTYLNRRYEIVTRIGTGGMADVYRGKDHKLRRYVAIKVLKPEFSEDESFVKKFQIEAQAAAGMLHPNVVNVYDVGVDLGYNYMVMELVDGITLKDYIQKKGRLSDKETISIAIQMAAGLDAAHQKKLVHRDVKPQNVMISNEGKVKVTDFGIAKPTTSTTATANVMGSVHYTSPEQARGSACDIQSDIYSAGITIYEMITGTVPFDGETTVAIAVKHLQEDIVPPSQYVPNIYMSLEQIILKCTQKNPSRRYLSMDDLMLDLKHSLLDPDGDFVDLGGLVYQSSVGRGYYNEDDGYDEESDEDYDDEDYDDEDYDDEDYDYDDDDDDYDGDDDDEDDDDDYAVDYDGSGEVDPRMKQITKILTIVVAVIVLFTVIFISVKAVNFFSNSNTDIEDLVDGEEMPDLVGMTEDEAIDLLKKYDLYLEVERTEESAIYEAGYIISQDVEAGESVEADTTIYVVVSSGIAEETVEVPTIVGMTEEEAQQELNAIDLRMDSDYEYSDTVDQGVVISVSPSEGTEVAVDSTVTVVVSKGEEPAETVSVPNLVGEKETYAKAILDSMGLESTSSEAYSDDYDEGYVIEQSIKAGEDVELGETIEYVVSMGPEIIYIKMPTVVGKEATAAAETLTSTGFKVTVEEQYNSSVSSGYVISASLSAGTEVEEGTEVRLIVSKGSEPVVEPDPEPEVETETDTSTDTEADTSTDTDADTSVDADTTE